MRMMNRRKVTIGGVVIGLGLLALTAGPLLAQGTPTPTRTTAPMDHAAMMATGSPAPASTPSTESMQQMMDQCVTMMNMMMGMMGGGMTGTPGTTGMPGMMGGTGMAGATMPTATPTP